MFMQGRKLYSVAEAARLLGISRTMLYRQIACGRITATKIGTRTLFTDVAINAYIELLEREAESQGTGC